MKKIVVIAHNLRSTHNVGSLLRTADGLGVERVILSGYTPYPASSSDARLPHIARKLDSQIKKTALGAEISVSWEHFDDIRTAIDVLSSEGYRIIALEQAAGAVSLPDYRPVQKLAVIIGREVDGIEADILERADEIVEIPMAGQKESFNVVQAAAIFLGYCLFR